MKRLFTVPVLVVAALSLAGCRSQSPAITVNGTEISIDELDADLVELAHGKYFRTNASELFTSGCQDSPVRFPSCRVTADAAASWATNVVLIEVVTQEAERRGIEVTDDEIAAQRAGYRDGFHDGFSESFTKRWILNDALYAKLVASLPNDDPTVDPSAALQQELMGSADVIVDPRYGVWDAEQQRVVVIGTAAPRERGGADFAPQG